MTADIYQAIGRFPSTIHNGLRSNKPRLSFDVRDMLQSMVLLEHTSAIYPAFLLAQVLPFEVD